MTRCTRIVFAGLCASVVIGLSATAPIAYSQGKDKVDLTKVPKKVMAALKGKFPKAKIHKWTKEKEGDISIFDFEFKQGEQKFEADIKEDGAFHNWEREIAAKDLPKAVKQTVRKKYGKSVRRNIKEIMEITAVKEGKDVLEGYEVVVQIAGNKIVEITVAPDGKILEDETDADN